MEAGDDMMLPCEGGPSAYRRARFPPPVELAVDGGVYVLHDDGRPVDWHYVFVASARI